MDRKSIWLLFLNINYNYSVWWAYLNSPWLKSSEVKWERIKCECEIADWDLVLSQYLRHELGEYGWKESKWEHRGSGQREKHTKRCLTVSWLPMKDVVRWPVRQTCWELAAEHEVEAQVWPHTTAATYEYTHSHSSAMSKCHLLKQTTYNVHEKVSVLIFNFDADETIKCQ